MTEKIRSYLKEMNVSERLADDMMIVPPEKMRILSSDELVQYGLGIIDPVAKEASDLKEARKLGISHTEYMRRQSLSDVLCRINDPTAISLPGSATPLPPGFKLSLECKNAVLSGKHVELAPPCRNRAATCQPWEREWTGRQQTKGDIVTNDGFVISGK
jgi:hypothetical protein